jgi:UDP:flavonoid glycosyltransferase YjiC (YdhE family)
MPKRRILIFTIPNDGHFNILNRLIREHRSSCDFRLVFTDQRNTPAMPAGTAAPVQVPAAVRGFVNTPASRVFERVATLLPECLRIAREYDPSLVLYDLCALEGHFVGRLSGIPYWCSIPGMVGPFVHQSYLAENLLSRTNQRAIGLIENRHRIDVRQSDVEVISNCLHLPGQVNLLWSYPAVTPPRFRDNRSGARYEFVGYLSDGHLRPPVGDGLPLIYLSFGTEVMDNLWADQEETRTGIRRCVAGLTRLWGPGEVDVILATQGKRILDSYPPNWTVRDRVDQQKVLSRADVFVTHGGSNSFHEALLHRVPMVVVPFFGDQVLVARRAEELGIGVDLGDGDGIDRNQHRRHLAADLAPRIAAAAVRLMATDTARRGFAALRLQPTMSLRELATVAEPAPAAAAPLIGATSR